MGWRFHPRFWKEVQALDEASRKAIGDTLRSFQSDPALPGHRLEKLSGDIYSLRASRGLRILLEKEADGWLLLYAGKHEETYRTYGKRIRKGKKNR